VNACGIYYVPGIYGSSPDNRFLYNAGEIFSAQHWIAENPVVLPPSSHHIEVMQYTLSSQADWSLEKCNPQIAEYMMLKDGRHNVLFGVGISIVMSAINHGFELPPEELADTIMELQRANPPSSRPGGVDRQNRHDNP
jgi:hypothetical protein